MNKTRYSATEFGGNKPMNFRLSGTLSLILKTLGLKYYNNKWLDGLLLNCVVYVFIKYIYYKMP